jgi:hypothetical protein
VKNSPFWVGETPRFHALIFVEGEERVGRFDLLRTTLVPQCS